MRRLLGVLDMSTRLAQLAAVGAVGAPVLVQLVQLLHKPLPQRRHPASVPWVWRGHHDPIHVRNVMGVRWSGRPATPVVWRTRL